MPGCQFYFELIGAVAFAISGAALAVKKHMDLFGVAMMGMTTAVGGGILRDVLAGETPSVLVRHVYAVASLLGAVAYILLRDVLPPNLATGCSALVTVVIRGLASHYRWNFPRITQAPPA